MDQALLKVGLPVKCRKCRKEGRVKPKNYGGWHKSQILRFKPNKWFCPEHAEIGKDMDERFYQISVASAEAQQQEQVKVEEQKSDIDELYELLD